jgi:hypothetical protein
LSSVPVASEASIASTWSTAFVESGGAPMDFEAGIEVDVERRPPGW